MYIIWGLRLHGQEGNQYLFERPGEDAFQQSVPRVCGILRSSADAPLVRPVSTGGTSVRHLL